MAIMLTHTGTYTSPDENVTVWRLNREFGKYKGNICRDVLVLENKGDYKLKSLEHSSTP